MVTWRINEDGAWLHSNDNPAKLIHLRIQDEDILAFLREWTDIRFPQENDSPAAIEAKRVERLRIHCKMDQEFARLRDKLKKLFDHLINNPENLKMIGMLFSSLNIEDGK